MELYNWNYTKGEYDKKGKNTESREFWFNVTINPSELSHYINNGTMIILVVQNGWSTGGQKSRLGTDYICVIQVIKK